MIRKLLLTAALAGSTLLAVSLIAQQYPQQPPAQGQQGQPGAQQYPQQPPSQGQQGQADEQPAANAKTVTGKVSAIGNGGHSFTVQLSQNGSDKGTMDFILDTKTQVQGKVRVGTPVTVVYQIAQGQNVAVSVTAQA